MFNYYQWRGAFNSQNEAYFSMTSRHPRTSLLLHFDLLCMEALLLCCGCSRTELRVAVGWVGAMWSSALPGFVTDFLVMLFASTSPSGWKCKHVKPRYSLQVTSKSISLHRPNSWFAEKLLASTHRCRETDTPRWTKRNPVDSLIWVLLTFPVFGAWGHQKVLTDMVKVCSIIGN